MILINLFTSGKQTPASIAKKRLQTIIFNRKNKNILDLHTLPKLQEELIQVICKYTYNPKILSIQLKQQDKTKSILEFNIIFFNENN